jgi:hypothetical protein
LGFYLAAGVAGLGIAFKSRIFHAPASRTSVALQSPSILNPALPLASDVVFAPGYCCIRAEVFDAANGDFYVVDASIEEIVMPLRELCGASKNSACGEACEIKIPSLVNWAATPAASCWLKVAV